MNFIRSIARQITRVASGVQTPKIYPASSWIYQPPIISSRFRLHDTLVSVNLFSKITEIKVSPNLLPKIPRIYETAKLFLPTEIESFTNTTISIPEIIELKGWLIEELVCLDSYEITVIAPNIFIEEIPEFGISELIEPTQPLVLSDFPQIVEDEFTFLEVEILKCCFSQKEDEEGIEAKQESKHATLPQLPNYCEILHPILLPPLSLEDHNELDFYNPLRGYQKQGIKFLFSSPSALLADEMGTGKTVQAVNALRLLFRQGHIKSALIVCPPAVIGSIDLSHKTGNSEGWSGHLYHWAPELKVIVMRGRGKEKRRLEWQKYFHIYITTYDTLRIDLNDGIITDLQQFDCIVLDEAQEVKNRETKTARAIRFLQASYRWALTGTPVENRLDDVISLFDFIRPGTFSGGMSYSPQDVSNTIEPFILRRLKKDVLQELPEKEYVESYLELDPSQKVHYDHAIKAARQEIKAVLNTNQQSQIKRHIFSLLPKLKQICNFAEGEMTSPKTDLLLNLLETIAANQQKVLIFSQYVVEGTDKIANLLTQNQIGYVLYTGSTSSQQRERAISDFRTNPEILVFLATTETAGYGITLTEATYVIHFDHLWNPAKMQNAEDRVHRIGQTKGVTVYSFWMKNTIEERIKQKLVYKRSLIDKAINSLATELGEDDLSTEDWLDIFDIKLGKTLDQRVQTRQLAIQTIFQQKQDKLSVPTTSFITREISEIKQKLEKLQGSPGCIVNIQGVYIILEQSVQELTLMSEKPTINFHQQHATIGVNYAAEGSEQNFTQNITSTSQNFEALLGDFEKFVNEVHEKHPNVTDETAIQIIDVEAKEIQQKQPLRWQNFLNLKSLWNGGKKAAFKVGEHYAEQNPLGKGAIAFLEGVMEEPK